MLVVERGFYYMRLKILPNIKIVGIDISNYGIKNSNQIENFYLKRYKKNFQI